MKKNQIILLKRIRGMVNALPKPQNRRKYELRLNYRTISVFLVCGTDLRHIHSYEPIVNFSNAVLYCNLKVFMKIWEIV